MHRRCRHAELAPLALAVIRRVALRPGPVALVRDDARAIVLDCGDRGDLWVFPWVVEHPHPAVDFLQALDGAGFNHVAAPLVRSAGVEGIWVSFKNLWPTARAGGPWR